MLKKKKRALLLASTTVIVLMATGVYAFISHMGGTSVLSNTTGDVSSTPQPHDYVPKSSGRPVPDGQLEYYAPQYGISVLYPNSLTSVKEFPEADGGQTTTFQYDDGKTIVGFQIYVTPFAGDQITEAQFKRDEPSGVRENLKNIKVDGATGASFFSKSQLLGATAEVWFIHGGYLYEVTTFKEEAQWLSDILQTWKFTQ